MKTEGTGFTPKKPPENIKPPTSGTGESKTPEGSCSINEEALYRANRLEMIQNVAIARIKHDAKYHPRLENYNVLLNTHNNAFEIYTRSLIQALFDAGAIK